MTEVRFYGQRLPTVADTHLLGKLIVLEGPDGVGRSTQIALLREWLEASGYAVFSSGLKRSELAGLGIAEAKQGHTLGRETTALFYAADFADRLEREILPALRAGFVVLTDRYVYSIIARSVVRGVDSKWIRSLMGFALIPDAILYMRCDLAHLIPRVLGARGFDYWESGMDVLRGDDIFENYRVYQTKLLAQFRQIGKEYKFITVDANDSVQEIFSDLRRRLKPILKGMQPTV